jgi:hypothetical protein
MENAECGQGTLALAPQADHLLERVLGAARDRKQAITGA